MQKKSYLNSTAIAILNIMQLQKFEQIVKPTI